jgi:uncharacterized membrane protein
MKTNLIKSLAVSTALSIFLLFFRIQWSGTLFYVFLVWNLFLAWIPFICSVLLLEAKQKQPSRVLLLLLFGSWLAFFPNSPYILTDLFHLKMRHDIPLWFDLILILSFAWNGLLLGFASLLNIQQFLKHYFSKNTLHVFVFALFLLCGFGIYLGRYPRFNSWDIVTNPITLFSDIISMITHPLKNTRMVGVTVFFSVFLIVSYSTLTSLIQHHKNEDK